MSSIYMNNNTVAAGTLELTLYSRYRKQMFVTSQQQVHQGQGHSDIVNLKREEIHQTGKDKLQQWKPDTPTVTMLTSVRIWGILQKYLKMTKLVVHEGCSKLKLLLTPQSKI